MENFRQHRRILIDIIYESSPFIQISPQRRIIDQITATTQLPCEVNAAKLDSLSSPEIYVDDEQLFSSL